MNLQEIEQKIHRLVEKSRKLEQENSDLRAQVFNLETQKQMLQDNNQQAIERVEKIIGRLKNRAENEL